MATRKIKDAKDLSTNELIYFKGHAQATYMSDGRTVEEAVNGMSGGLGGSIDTSNFATKDELAQKQDIIPDIALIRNNAANYKGTVTSVKVNGVSKTPDSNGAVDVGYKFKQKIESTASSISLAPNIYYVMTSVVTSYIFTLTTLGNTDFMQEHFVEFTTSSSGTTVSFPTTVKWANGVVPVFEAGSTYQVSIVNNLGTWVKFK